MRSSDRYLWSICFRFHTFKLPKVVRGLKMVTAEVNHYFYSYSQSFKMASKLFLVIQQSKSKHYQNKIHKSANSMKDKRRVNFLEQWNLNRTGERSPQSFKSLSNSLTSDTTINKFDTYYKISRDDKTQLLISAWNTYGKIEFRITRNFPI